MCVEQSLNEEYVFARLVICPGFFEQLSTIQQYLKLCRAESKTDICLVRYPAVGTKCLNLEIIPRDLLIFEETDSICCFEVRFELI